MKPAPINADEAQRLAALQQYTILDTPAEAEFDDFTKLASGICHTPIALISLVDAGRQWFKSKRGLDAPETPRDISFCGHAIHGREILEVPNALEDERFSDNPLVSSGPNIRFYAGAPLVTPEGHAIGTLCVIDSVPRQLSEAQRESLAALGRQVVRQLELKRALAQTRDMAARREESEERFHQLFLHTGQGVVIKQADGRISDANPAAERILGQSSDEIRGVTSLDPRWRAVREDGTELPGAEHPSMVALRSGEPVTGVVMGVFHPRDNDWRWIRVDAYPRRAHAGGPVLQVYVVFSDITETRQAYLEVRQARKFLSDVLAAASEVSIIATDRDGLITNFNVGAERMVGYSAAEMVGRQSPAILHLPAEVAARGAALGSQFGQPVEGFRVFVVMPERHRSEQREWTYVHKDGHLIPVSLVVTTMRDDAGEIVGYLGIAEDITERKRAADALRDQTQRTQAILDNVIDGIITIDEVGNVASLNRAAERIFGFAPAEVLGQNIKMLMPEPFHTEHDSYLSSFRATGVERIIGIGHEVVGLRKDGNTFPMDLSVSEISHAGKRMFVGLMRDITERKRVERMKSEFVSTVSHELRTPLTSIAGALGLLTGGAMGELPPLLRPMIDIALKNSLRLNHLINDLLDMEKIAAGKMHFDMQALDLMPLVEQALEANKGYGEQRRVRFVLTERLESASVRIDGQRFQQVLANFLSNAAKFSPEGGQVEVAVALHHGRVRVAVRDHGSGIPNEFRTRIFEKFSQADASDTRQKGGTGLGLAITKELVEKMGGAVGFESTEGQGATFWIDLPLRRNEAAGADAAASLSAEAGNAGAPRVLVVEDDPDIAHLLTLMLSRAGYRTALADSGERALALLDDGDFAAMTLDLLLPGMSGLEVISRVRCNPASAELPIIVVSASVEEGRLAIDGDFSAIDWLPKPLIEDRLLLALEQALPRQRPAHPRVLHVEDDADLHQVIRGMVGSGFEFAHAASLSEARALLGQAHYDLVLLDLSLPDGSGWELLPLIREQTPAPRVIILSGIELSREEAGKVEAALLKSHVSPHQLLEALNARIKKHKEMTP